MSIRIRTGFRIRNCTVADAARLAHGFAPKVEKAAYRGFARETARIAVSALDMALAGGATDPDHDTALGPIAIAEADISVRFEAVREGRRDPAIDYSCGITVIPRGQDLIGVLDIEAPELWEEWLGMPGVEDFGYWNHTDSRPEGVTEAAWEYRRQEWAAALEPHWSPARAGKSVLQIPSRIYQPSDELILGYAPSFGDRLELLASRLVIDSRLNSILAKDPSGPGDTRQVIRAYHDATDWTLSREGSQAIEDERTRLRTVLPRIIGIELLRRPLRDTVQAQRRGPSPRRL